MNRPPASQTHFGRGIRMRVFRWEPAGPTDGAVDVLLIHGLRCNLRVWEEIGAKLAAGGLAVMAVELRGHGLTDGSSGRLAPSEPTNGNLAGQASRDDPYTLASLSMDVLDAAGPVRVVAGHSLGGAIGLELAAICPLVNQVVTVAGYIHARFDGRNQAQAVAQLIPPNWTDPLEVWKRTIAEYWVPRRPDPAWLERYAADGLKTNSDGACQPTLAWEEYFQIADSLARHNPVETLKRTDAKLTAVLGDADNTCVGAWQDEASIRLARPDANIVHVPNGGHYLPLGHPEKVIAAIVQAAGES